MLTRALVCLAVLSCAREPSERALEPAAPPHAPAAPLPFPDTAFRDEGAPSDPAALAAPANAPRASYETRRIGAAPPAAPRYHGAPVDLDLKGAELANVFRLLSDVGHVNIVVSGDVTGTITLRLKHVPWDQALEVVARARDLELAYDGNVIVVRAAGKH